MPERMFVTASSFSSPKNALRNSRVIFSGPFNPALDYACGGARCGALSSFFLRPSRPVAENSTLVRVRRGVKQFFGHVPNLEMTTLLKTTKDRNGPR
jgi:hypothetical protein